jgi:hypothetical protein
MNRLLPVVILILIVVLLIILARLSVFKSNESNEVRSIVSDERAEIQTKSKCKVRTSYPSPFKKNHKMIIRSGEDNRLSDDLDKDYDLSGFRIMSDDDEYVKLMALISNNPGLLNNPDIEIIPKSEAIDQLFFKGVNVFSAEHLYKSSVSKNGVIAIEAITNPSYPTYKDPGIDYDLKNNFFPVSYGEIWIIEPNGKPYRITPNNMNARDPSISGDGEKVAFVANFLDQTNSMLYEILVIYDLNNKKVQYYNSPNMKNDHYVISPIMWIKDDSVLRVVEDWGETGGHGRVGYIESK